MVVVTRFSLAAFFLGVALVKIWAGHQPRFDLGPSWFYVLTYAELLTGLALLTRFRRLGSCSALLLSSGIVMAAIWSPNADCGCLGGLVEIDAARRLLLGGIAGLLSCILLLVDDVFRSTAAKSGVVT